MDKRLRKLSPIQPLQSRRDQVGQHCQRPLFKDAAGSNDSLLSQSLPALALHHSSRRHLSTHRGPASPRTRPGPKGDGPGAHRLLRTALTAPQRPGSSGAEGPQDPGRSWARSHLPTLPPPGLASQVRGGRAPSSGNLESKHVFTR